MGFKDFLAELQIEMNMYEGKNSDPKTVVSGRGSNEYGAIFCTLF